MSNEVLIYLEADKNGVLDCSLELVSGVKEISGDMKVSCALVMPNFEQTDEIKENIKKAGADKLYLMKSGLEALDKRLDADFLIELIKKYEPEIVLYVSTSNGREVAPIVAMALETGLTADCTKIEITKKDEKNVLISTRPTFGGKLKASILCKTNPQMATVRKNTFKRKFYENENLEIVEFQPEKTFDLKYEILNLIETKGGEFLNLNNAKIILTGGMGLKNKENFDKLKHLAELIGAKTGATRKAVDKGFIEREFQIGQTGSCVAPELYIAFGVSGAIHHIAGCENSKKIIAINTDKNAPVFQAADIGIIKDAQSVLDDLIRHFEK